MWLLPTIWSLKFLHRHFLRLLHLMFPHGGDGGDGTLLIVAAVAAGGVVALVFVLWVWAVVAVMGSESYRLGD
jgi:hypothetical protein